MIDYRIVALEPYDQKVGELVSMLEHTRGVTLEEVRDLSIDELDEVPEDEGNSIGALLLHMAAIEFVHQLISFEKRDVNEEEWKEWKVALQLGEEARNSIKGNPLSYYLKTLNDVRENTLKYLSDKQDDWLLEEDQWGNGAAYNQRYLWFHVFEDEINHRGQIRVLKRRLRT
ncbi:DinB family protein [Halobacillus litoralis]|uniref:DinB family protein n=1 Tax=Halobacillus litoralis TaxID=45668 RepID=UPI001CD1A50A|nr:DinB family protein [Halobacillus litoralis]MCA0971999.1 DinB family protein [Halobacillus litoralis]